MHSPTGEARLNEFAAFASLNVKNCLSFSREYFFGQLVKGNDQRGKAAFLEETMKRTIWRLGIAAVAIIITAAAGGKWNAVASAPTQEKTAEMVVKIDHFTFSPATITVTAGSTVRWTNHDDIPHSVVSEDKSFKSKAMDTDENFSYTFTKPGTYSYLCSIHPRMTGKIIVQ
jgi:plastocyanin